MNQHKTIIAWLGFLAVLLAIGFMCKPALAQEPAPVPESLFSVKRLSIAVGTDYAWVSKTNLTTAGTQKFKGWDAVVAGAYQLTPSVDLVSKVGWSFNDGAIRSTVGVRVLVFSGSK